METYKPLHYIFRPARTATTNTLLLLHGTGGDETDLLPLADAFGDYAVLSVRGNVLENGMPRFFRRLGMGIFDEEDLLFRTGELRAFLKTVSEAEKLDPDGFIAVGYSNGANIAASMLALYPDFLRGAALYRPMQPFRDKARQQPASRHTSVLIVDGMYDQTIKPAAKSDFNRLLEEAGFKLTVHNLATGHQLTGDDVRLTKLWLEQQGF